MLYLFISRAAVAIHVARVHAVRDRRVEKLEGLPLSRGLLPVKRVGSGRTPRISGSLPCESGVSMFDAFAPVSITIDLVNLDTDPGTPWHRCRQQKANPMKFRDADPQQLFVKTSS